MSPLTDFLLYLNDDVAHQGDKEFSMEVWN